MSKFGKNAVLLARVPDEFEPSSVSDIPGIVLSANVHKSHLTLCAAIDVCRRYNAERLATGRPVREWAILVKWVRPIEQPKGGAA